MISALLDVNVLIALLDANHIHYDAAIRWLETDGERGWATCPLTINGCARIFGRVDYADGPGSVAGALERLSMLCGQFPTVFWPDDISLLHRDQFHPERIPGSSNIADIYLLGLVIKRDGCLVTFDRSIRLDAVVGAEPRHLRVLV